MSKQKDKFELFRRLAALGFSYDEAHALRRIEMTLQRWAELECGTTGANGRSDVSIERDGENGDGKPFMRIGCDYGHGYKITRYPVADREAGALRRLAAIMARHRSLVAYHQGDCRGCTLYIVRRRDLRGKLGEKLPVAQFYTRGLAVAA